MKCDICRTDLYDGDWICSGLDIPELGFCKQHKEQHQYECESLIDGKAAWSKIGADKRSQSKRSNNVRNQGGRQPPGE
jgi:hypothetical protein